VETEHGSVAASLGIPYAAPPVGPRRFAQAEPAKAWSGTHDATQFGPSAPQNDDPLGQLLGLAVGDARSEDCLTINVWTPAIDDRRRQVLVWIHGGAFISGSSTGPVYDGARLCARGDVVVVTFNYRVGALGYLYLDEQRSNLGLGDQIAALAWVHDNIAAFGGDPEHVTIGGQSAGGGSVCALLAAPAARGLFHAAILQSAAPNGFVTVDEAIERRERVLVRMREAGHADIEHASVHAWLDAQAACASERQWRHGMLFTPVVGGAWLPCAPMQAIANADAPPIPLLICSNRDELQLFSYGAPKPDLPPAMVDGMLAAMLPGLDVASICASFRAARAARGESLIGIDVLHAILAELAIRCPLIRIAEHHAGRGCDTFMALFEWSAALDGLGACHGLELPFVLDALALPELAPLIGSDPAPRQLAQHMSDAWLAFVRDGRPHAPALGEWPAYSSERRATMRLGLTTGIELDPRAPERSALDFI
jgi:para-nitrobenzyl esterase